jgi:hypothetical protein
MSELQDARLLYLKCFLLLVAGCLAAGLILAERPTLRLALLLAVAVWAFCRAYYFAFYVIEHYVDPGYRFAGLGSFAMYLLCRRYGRKAGPSSPGLAASRSIGKGYSAITIGSWK